MAVAPPIHAHDEWRVILRFSLDHDTGSALRNRLAGILRPCGIRRIAKTGTWESVNANAQDAARIMGNVLTTLADPQNQNAGVAHYTKLDHFWLYIERVRH